MANCISSFIVPNTQEDIFEYIILAASNIDPVAYDNTGDGYGSADKPGRLLVSNAWDAKYNQVYQKAKIMFKNDSRLKEIDCLSNTVKYRTKILNATQNKYAERGGETGRNHIMKKFVSVILAMTLILGIFPARVEAAELRPFQVYIVSDTSSFRIVGDFLEKDGELFVSMETLGKLNVSEGLVIDRNDSEVCLQCRDKLYFVPDNQCTELNGVNYYLFDAVMSALDFTTVFDEESRQLLVNRCKNLEELAYTIEEVYKDPRYDLSDWQKSDFYGFSTFMAKLTDITKNIKVFEYISGQRQRGIYQKAIWSILIPSTEDENLEFLEETNSTLETLAKAKKNADNLTELILDGKNSGFMGDLGEVAGAFGKAADYIQMKEVISALKYVAGMKNMEESYRNGLHEILTKKTDGNQKNTYWYWAADGAYVTLTSCEPMWMMLGDELFGGITDDLVKNASEEVIKKRVLKALMGKYVIALDVESYFMDLVMDTQTKVDATLLAEACLTIQKRCSRYYDKYRGNTAGLSRQDSYPTAEKLDNVRNLRDVTCLYLRSGLAAYKALAVDDEMKADYAEVAAVINSDLEELLSYQDSDFDYVLANEESSKRLTDFWSGLSEEDYLISASKDGELYGIEEMQISWLSAEAMSTDESVLELSIEGEYQGEEVSAAISCSKYYRDENGKMYTEGPYSDLITISDQYEDGERTSICIIPDKEFKIEYISFCVLEPLLNHPGGFVFNYDPQIKIKIAGENDPVNMYIDAETIDMEKYPSGAVELKVPVI